jgi:hypothetical protein
VTFDPVIERPAADLASRIVWFDAYVTNVDRTVRNTNMLMWHRRLWLIDHGATLYFHHSPEWPAGGARARDAFPLIREHVLLRAADRLLEIDESMAGTLTAGILAGIVDLIPSAWLGDGTSEGEGARYRAAYRQLLLERLAPPRAFVEEAVRAR